VVWEGWSREAPPYPDHLTRGEKPGKETLNWLGQDLTLPKPGDVRIAGIVGSDLDPSIGMPHEEHGITTRTLWGEIAYQLGGAEGYKIAEESDTLLAAPGTQLLEEIERLLDSPPMLIMIDEVARYLRAGSAYPTKTGKFTLADQTIAFLMSLIEYAASRKNVVVVLTFAGEMDAFSDETAELQKQLAESKAVSARQERVLRPSDEGEMPAIVVHRLFKKVDRKSARDVIKRYSDYCRELFEKNADLPERAGRAAYAGEFIISYPFHPDFLQVLENKVSTIPNFQRTRGALRLLALVVRRLWEEKPEGCCAIHSHHLGLGDEDIVEELTSRLDRPRFKQVVQADIVSEQEGSRAHAQEVDDTYPHPYAQRLGTTIFLHSLS
jgi:predicted AAA+ superfamily ATPase